MKSCFVQFFGRNVNQFSIKSVVCQMCDKYKIWQCLHSARISVIYFYKYIYMCSFEKTKGKMNVAIFVEHNDCCVLD